MKKRIILTSVYLIFLLLYSSIVFAPTARGIDLCSPGKLRCNNNLIEICDSGGSSYSPVEKCDSNCKYDKNGVPYCPKDGNGDGGKIKYIIILGFIIFLIWISRKITFRNKRIYFSKQQEEVKEKLMYCKHCGSKVSKSSKFCNECGKKL